MGKPRAFMVHELTDGTFVTAQDVADKVGCAITTARCRLTRSKDPAMVYKKVTNLNKKGKGRYPSSYKLDDGSVWTLEKISKHTGLTKNAISGRLHKSRKASVVLKPKHINSTVVKQWKVTAETKQRMYYDPDGFWKIFNKIA